MPIETSLRRVFTVSLAVMVLNAGASAGEADVIDASATSLGGDQWRIAATIRHGDTGWDHYANAFEVVGPDGETLETRVLYHPHVNEQPFTRSVVATIPSTVTSIRVRALDLVHGAGGAEIALQLSN